VKGEKKVILDGFLSALGLTPATPSTGREAADAAYDPEQPSGVEARAVSEVAGARGGVCVPPPPPPRGVQQAVKNAAASAITSALSNISNAAAAARAAETAATAASEQKESGVQATDADATVAAALQGEEAKEKRSRSDSSSRERRAKKDRDRDRGRDRDRRSRQRSKSRKRRRRSSSAGSTKRRAASRSRSPPQRCRGLSREARRRGRGSRFSLDGDPSTATREPLVGLTDMQAAEQLAMARRMSTIQGTPGEHKLRPGDWNCPICGAHNFASKFQCFRCAKAKNPFLEGVFNLPISGMGMGMNEPAPQNMKVGDWLCSRCNAHNFASKFQCFRCGQGKNPMLDTSALALTMPGTAQVGGRSAAGLALKAAAMAGAKGNLAAAASHANTAAVAISQGFADRAPPGFSNVPSIGFSDGPASGAL